MRRSGRPAKRVAVAIDWVRGEGRRFRNIGGGDDHGAIKLSRTAPKVAKLQLS